MQKKIQTHPRKISGYAPVYVHKKKLRMRGLELYDVCRTNGIVHNSMPITSIAKKWSNVNANGNQWLEHMPLLDNGYLIKKSAKFDECHLKFGDDSYSSMSRATINNC